MGIEEHFAVTGISVERTCPLAHAVEHSMVVRVAMLIVLAIFLAGGHVFAQERGGFTLLVDLGVGVQNDTTIDKTQVGLAGLNVGVGGFLTRDFALMFRIAGTTVSYDLGALGYHTQL